MAEVGKTDSLQEVKKALMVEKGETEFVWTEEKHRTAGHIRGEVFTESGKWKYTVWLEFQDYNGRYVPEHKQLEDALYISTMKDISEVTFRRLHLKWFLVVFDPPFGYPAMVMGVGE